MFTDIERIIEQVEEIVWVDSYLWRDKDDFIKFIRNLDLRESELEDEISRLYDRYDELQEDYDDLNKDYNKQCLRSEELEEEIADLLKKD